MISQTVYWSQYWMIGWSQRRALVSTIPDVDMSPLACEQ